MRALISNHTKFNVNALIILIALAVFSFGCSQRTEVKYQTCSICNSVRVITTKYRLAFIPVITDEVIKYKSKNYNHGAHHWVDGVSRAVMDPVRDGIVVLVHKDGNYGAFILNKQDVNPEGASYTWYFRTDGKGIFNRKMSAVKSGSDSGAHINFGPFTIDWSGYAKGSGWIYYSRSDGDPKKPQDLYICVTEQKTVEGIDAASSKWIYKSSRFDE
jgi:hypothetical protein